MFPTYELIASQTLGSSASSVTFSSIPQTYDDLVLVTSTRGDTANVDVSTFLAFNGSTANMTRRLIYGDGSNAYSASTSTSIYANTAAATSTSNTFTSAEVYVPNYAGATYKSWSSSATHENNATFAIIHAIAGLWSVTSAITSVGFSVGAGNFVTGSSFYLFGIREETA